MFLLFPWEGDGRYTPTMNSYPYLGALLDLKLTYAPHLATMLSRGQDAFNCLLMNAFCQGLPLPFQAGVIPTRVETAALYGLELCIGIPNAQHALNKMQASWARSLLGVSSDRHGYAGQRCTLARLSDTPAFLKLWSCVLFCVLRQCTLFADCGAELP